MYLPEIKEKRQQASGVVSFYGLDMHPTATLGWFSADENVCSDEYPMLTVRPSRGLCQRSPEFTGASAALVIEERLCAVDHQYLWVGDERIDLGLSEGEKLLVPFSYYLLIWPDKVYVNVLDLDDRGSMEEKEELFGLGDIRITVCNRQGQKANHVGLIEPGGIVEYLDLWYKPRGISSDGTPDTPAALYQQVNVAPETNGARWQEVESHLIFERVDAYNTGIVHEALTAGEYIVTDGFGAYNLNPGSSTPRERDMTTLNGAHSVVSVRTLSYSDREETDAFIVRGILQEHVSYTFTNDPDNLITVRRAVPDLQHAVCAEGRLYGAYRGVSSISGEEVNELYISAAGDFKRFYRVEDTTADPLVMSVSEPGAFRGAAVVGGAVTFFKDRKILTVGGSSPESFYINTYDGRGPSAGCERSLTVLGGNAYYLADGQVLAYYGGTVTVLSERLGVTLRGVTSAVGGGYGHKYYLSVCRTGGPERLLVYDILRGLWHAERVPPGGVTDFCEHACGVYAVSGRGQIWAFGDVAALGGTVPASEGLIPWYWESGMIGLDSPQATYILKVEVRLVIEEGARARLLVQYDSTPVWRPVWRAEAGRARTVRSRMIPHRCDHVRIRLQGTGRVTLLGVFITEEKGGGR